MITPKGIRNISDARDFTDTTGPATDGYSMVWDNATSKFVLSEVTGVSDHGALTGLADDDHTQYLLATGARAGATAQAQTFTNGVVTGTIRPASDSTTAIQFQNAAGGAFVVLNSANQQLIVKNTLNSRTFTFDAANSSLDSSENLQMNRSSGKNVAIGNSSDSRFFVGQDVGIVKAAGAKVAIGNESVSIHALAVGGPRTGTPTGDLLVLCDYFNSGSPSWALNAKLFAVGPTGQIKTNQTVTNTNTPSGATAHQLPIYNAAGTLLGYIPIYASAW